MNLPSRPVTPESGAQGLREAPHIAVADFGVNNRVSAASEVHYGQGQCFIEGHISVSGAAYSRAVTDGFRQRSSKHDAEVFD